MQVHTPKVQQSYLILYIYFFSGICTREFVPVSFVCMFSCTHKWVEESLSQALDTLQNYFRV